MHLPHTESRIKDGFGEDVAVLKGHGYESKIKMFLSMEMKSLPPHSLLYGFKVPPSAPKKKAHEKVSSVIEHHRGEYQDHFCVLL